MKVKIYFMEENKDLTLNFGRSKVFQRNTLLTSIFSIDGEQGFPGELKTTCKYSIQGNKNYF